MTNTLWETGILGDEDPVAVLSYWLALVATRSLVTPLSASLPPPHPINVTLQTSKETYLLLRYRRGLSFVVTATSLHIICLKSVVVASLHSVAAAASILQFRIQHRVMLPRDARVGKFI